MRFKRLFPALAAAVILLAVITACGGNDRATGTPTPTGDPGVALFTCNGSYPGSDPDASTFPVDVTDGSGRAITVDEAPTRIASLSAGHTEALFAMGAGGQIVAVDNTSNCPDATTGLEHVDAFNVSVEAITALEPDMVVLFFDPGDLVQTLEDQLGVPVLLYPSPGSVSDLYNQIESLGAATGHPGEAQFLVQQMKDRIKEIISVTDPATAPAVYHELDNTYFTVGPGSFVHDMYTILGAKNIAAGTGEAFPQLSAEAIISANPDVIVLGDEGLGETTETVADRPGWDAIAAVQNGRIYGIDPDLVSRPGPRVVDAIEELAKDLYPESGE